MNQHQVEEIINYAIQRLLANDAELLELDVSERAVVFHLGRYICERTPADLDVDCEYNRHLKDVKQLLYLKRLLDIEENHEVFPDILIHRRNRDDQNIVVIEIKKYGQNRDADFRRLLAFKNKPYSYRFAVQVVIGTPNSGVEFVFV